MRPKQRIIILSDIEMGAGGEEDDFPHTGFLADLITSFNHERYQNEEVHFVFNGDTFDFLKTSYEGAFPHLIHEGIALGKLERIAKVHAGFFAALKSFIEVDPRHRQAHFVVGNHDSEILFPRVQATIRELCGFQSNIAFPGFHLDFGRLHIEHGSQHDPLFVMDPDRPFIIHKGETYLNLPWASIALLNVVMPMQKEFCQLDRLKPKALLYDIFPEMKEYLVSRFWQYWKQDYLKEALKSLDPIKKVSWNMISEVVKRSTRFSSDVRMEQNFHKRLHDSERFSLYVMGHEHESRVWSYGNRKVVQTGCFRNEFMLEQGGGSVTPIAKNYLEVEVLDERVLGLQNHEVICEQQYEVLPELPQNYRPKVLEWLGSSTDRLKSKLDIEQQESKESKESDGDKEPGFFAKWYSRL